MKIIAIFNGLIKHLPFDLAAENLEIIEKYAIRKSEMCSVILSNGKVIVGVLARILNTGEVVFKASVNDVESKSWLAGKTIAESNIRRTTGATIMAIERRQKLHRYPLGNTIFEEGDRLLVVGSPDEQAKFIAFLDASEA